MEPFLVHLLALSILLGIVSTEPSSIDTHTLGYNSFTLPLAVQKEPGQVEPEKLVRGEASASSILYTVGWGDAGINKAAENAGIKKIVYVDKIVSGLPILLRNERTIVYGYK